MSRGESVGKLVEKTGLKTYVMSWFHLINQLWALVISSNRLSPFTFKYFGANPIVTCTNETTGRSRYPPMVVSGLSDDMICFTCSSSSVCRVFISVYLRCWSLSFFHFFNCSSRWEGVGGGGGVYAVSSRFIFIRIYLVSLFCLGVWHSLRRLMLRCLMERDQV